MGTSQVLFGLIVGEGGGEVGGESQDAVLVVAQADEQIVSWPLGFSPSGAGPFDGVHVILVQKVTLSKAL
jgi:hypothetical protein